MSHMLVLLCYEINEPPSDRREDMHRSYLCTPVLRNKCVIRLICATNDFLTYTLPQYFSQIKFFFHSCPHIRQSSPIVFRKKPYISRKCLSRYSVLSKEIRPRTLSLLK